MIIVDRNTVVGECFCDVYFVCELHEFSFPRENVSFRISLRRTLTSFTNQVITSVSIGTVGINQIKILFNWF